jgi:hypothetical protein
MKKRNKKFYPKILPKEKNMKIYRGLKEIELLTD